MVAGGQWASVPKRRGTCRVIDVRSIWGETFYRVWLPTENVVVRVRADDLMPLSQAPAPDAHHIGYVAAAARIAAALTEDVLLAPLDASVIPLPHQVRALSRAVSSDRVRYLLADEVGLGKTIEAGLILRELKLRGLVRRVLVVAPKGLVTQWVSEMRTHFAEEFRLVSPDDLKALRRLSPADRGKGSAVGSFSPWTLFDQVVCPMDSIKPLESRRGWSRDEVAEYNRERFEDLIAADWDLIVVDEAHRLAGSTDQVARYRLGQGLASAAPYLLLLSATPHQGKTDAFHRLMALIDPEAFPDVASITRERIRPYVIRTEKRRAIDARGQPLFQPRQTRLVTVEWAERHRRQRLLYEAVTDYVREGYNQAIEERRTYIGFLMLLMQRLVTSSTRAIRFALERRLDALQDPDDLRAPASGLSEDEWNDLDGQEQVDLLLNARLAALANERREVTRLLEAARSAENAGPDAKAEALLDGIYRLQREEVNPDVKVLVFTEFVPTQEMLRHFLADRGFSVVCLNGSMDVAERRTVQDAFARDAQILISTDAGGEGLNLQFCHVVVNYDMPWNPMRLEQRIGRVDRIGQTHPVSALNFVLADTIEHRVQEVLTAKLSVILKDLGVDKASDVLDSGEAGQIFDELYRESILHPESLEEKVASVAEQVRDQARAARDNGILADDSSELDPSDARRLLEHPLPHWVERMTVSYLRSRGGKAERTGGSWNLTWPDGEEMASVVFTSADAGANPAARQVALEEERIRVLVTRIPPWVEGMPIPWLEVPDVPPTVQGFWSLWRVGLHTVDATTWRILPLFLQDNGKVFLPTARRIWDRLLADSVEPSVYLDGVEAADAFARCREVAENQGRAVYENLVQKHRASFKRVIEKGEYAFAARRRMIERIGLPAVRAHRLAALAREERSWREQLDRRAEVSPDLEPLLLIRVEGTKS